MIPRDGISDGIERSAFIDGAFRYSLGRQWGRGPVVLWILCNPSVADAEDDDQTVRKGMGFSRRWGFGGMVFANMWAFRAQQPRDLLTELRANRDVVGPKNDYTLGTLADSLRFVVCAWGDCGSRFVKPRAVEVRNILARERIVPCTLGFTAAGNPKHPLTLGYTTKLTPWGQEGVQP